MSSSADGSDRILGSVRSADGKGVVRVQDSLDTGIEDLWSALTEPRRLARWYGEVDGDLRLGGEFRAHVFASEWEGTGRVEVCEPPHRLRVVSKNADEPVEDTIEAALTADGGQTVLVVEQGGLPRDQLAAYGAGLQIHVEDLVAHLIGRDRCDARARWGQLFPAYQDLAANVG